MADYIAPEYAAEARADQQRAALRGPMQRFGRSGRLTMQVPVSALMRAVNTEGREVLTPAAKGYWEDQQRLYPWIKTMPDGGFQPVSAMRNRFGRVAWRKVYS